MGGGGKNRNNFATSRRKKRIFAWSVTTGTEKAVIIHKVIMFATLKIELVNDHIIIVDNGQRILMDTGSPLSFHPTGHLSFGENQFEVVPEIPGGHGVAQQNSAGRKALSVRNLVVGRACCNQAKMASP